MQFFVGSGKVDGAGRRVPDFFRDVLSAIAFFKTDMALVAQEFAAIPPAPPVAFHARLIDASRIHSKDQFDHQFQGHTGTNGTDPAARVRAAGYTFSTTAENVFANAESVFHGHAGFEIDWGNDAGGLQNGRGHRVNIHSPAMREVGVGVVLGTNGTVGPQVVTQEFGTQLTGAGPLLTGVAYYDLTGDDFYSPGEGLGGISVTVTDAGFSARTAPSGAFTVPLPGNGTFTVRFSGLGIDQTGSVTVGGGQNVKLDLKRAFSPPILAGSTTPPAGQGSPYTIASVPGASRYQLEAFRRDTATPTEPAENASRVTLAVSGGYNVVQSAIRTQGANAFNLRIVEGASQSITLNRTFLARTGAALTFSSRLGLATPDETARVQVSTDGGLSWSDVFTQAGTGGAGEGAFATQNRSLAALEGKTFQVRLLYSFTSGTFFITGNAVGWYIDDLRLPNCEELMAEPVRDLGAETNFTFTPAAAGTNYLLRVGVYNGAHRLGASEALFATAAQAGTPPPASGSYLANLSVRTAAGSGAQTLIVGFAVSGGSKPLLVRGIGPALGGFGVAGALADPRLDLFRSGEAAAIASNDNWDASAAATFSAVGAFGLTNGSRDAALVTTLGTGSYTAQVGSVGSAAGIALVELYDTTAGSGAKLSNVSARSQVGTGAEILVTGFNIGGTGPRRLLIRAVGPGLAAFGLTGLLADPKLDLFRSGTETAIASNDNWDLSAGGTFTQVGAFELPSGSRDAVLLVTLDPGSYTAQVSGINNTIGVALVEVYDVP